MKTISLICLLTIAVCILAAPPRIVTYQGEHLRTIPVGRASIFEAGHPIDHVALLITLACLLCVPAVTLYYSGPLNLWLRRRWKILTAAVVGVAALVVILSWAENAAQSARAQTFRLSEWPDK